MIKKTLFLVSWFGIIINLINTIRYAWFFLEVGLWERISVTSDGVLEVSPLLIVLAVIILGNFNEISTKNTKRG